MKMPTDNLSQSNPSKSVSKGGGYILIAALVAILGGLIYWYTLQNQIIETTPTSLRPAVENNTEPETPTATARVQNFTAFSTSDEITAIEADIESTYLDDLEAELPQIDAALTEALQE